ncbi:MAG: AbrB/MazE/SpoVT family DNA-binding domain-containing protein [Gemmatimonadota bacterium]|jgi:putative addiction module antidote
MRVKETVIRPIGNSAGVTIPKETLEKFGLEKGAKVFLRETDEGVLVTPYDPHFERAMTIYRKGAQRYRNAMRELSKR